MGQGNSHDGYLVGHSGAMPNSETLLQNHKPISSHTNKENAHWFQGDENCRYKFPLKRSKYGKKVTLLGRDGVVQNMFQLK